MPADCEVPRPPRKTRLSPAERLRDALMALSAGQARIVSHAETAWASITFAGARHRIELLFEGEAAILAGETFLALLPEHEFALPGQLVADAAILEVDHRLVPVPRMRVAVELLVLDEA